MRKMNIIEFLYIPIANLWLLYRNYTVCYDKQKKERKKELQVWLGICKSCGVAFLARVN